MPLAGSLATRPIQVSPITFPGAMMSRNDLWPEYSVDIHGNAMPETDGTLDFYVRKKDGTWVKVNPSPVTLDRLADPMFSWTWTVPYTINGESLICRTDVPMKIVHRETGSEDIPVGLYFLVGGLTRLTIQAPDFVLPDTSFVVSGVADYKTGPNTWSPLPDNIPIFIYYDDTQVGNPYTSGGQYLTSVRRPPPVDKPGLPAGTWTLKVALPQGNYPDVFAVGITRIRAVPPIALPLLVLLGIGAVTYVSRKKRFG